MSVGKEEKISEARYYSKYSGLEINAMKIWLDAGMRNRYLYEVAEFCSVTRYASSGGNIIPRLLRC
jgi:hypothetical protein